LSSLLYARLGCGLRSIAEALAIINDVFGGILGKIPSYATINNWIQKCGLDVYKSAGEGHKGEEYAEVVDESMMIGSEKLLMTLGIPSAHLGRPLNHTDVSVLRMAVSESWTGEKVKEELEKAASKVGHPPKYVISDNASTISKGIRLTGIPQHCDISHTLGVYLERTYKKESDFTAFLKNMTGVKFRLNMKKIAYLLPPTQRTIARFINMTDWVKWAGKMLDIYHTFSAEEKEAFSFIPANASLIDELGAVLKCVERIEHICKHQGLCKESILLCKAQIKGRLCLGNSRMIKLAQVILQFLDTQAAMLDSDKDVRNNSSDIIEAVFGMYKSRKSPNKLHGVTPFILFIPAYLQIKKEQSIGQFRFKERLERTRLKDIYDWKADNLSPNLVSKRTLTLKKAG
jgi:hypothetical protein